MKTHALKRKRCGIARNWCTIKITNLTTTKTPKQKYTQAPHMTSQRAERILGGWILHSSRTGRRMFKTTGQHRAKDVLKKERVPVHSHLTV